MQNFANTEWEQLTEEEIFNNTQGLVFTTIKRQFPNRESFCSAHMLEYDDLVQMGNIGLLNAIRSFKNDGSTKFRTHAINHIIWEISNQSKVQSLRNKDNRTFDLVDCVSTENKIVLNYYGSETQKLEDTLPITSDKETDNIAEEKVLEKEVIEFLKQDKEMDNLTLQILISKIKGLSVEEISKQLGIHRNSVYERLRTGKIKRIKGRLEKFLEMERK